MRGNEQTDKLVRLAPVREQLFYDMYDVITALWDKALSESEDKENEYVHRMGVKPDDHLINWQLVQLAWPLSLAAERRDGACSDNTPLFTSYGCFPDDIVKPLNTKVVPTVLDVLACFSSCGTNSVAVKLERCLCLRDVPDINNTLNGDKYCSKTCQGNFHENCGDARTFSVYQRDKLSYSIPHPAWSVNISSCGFFQRTEGNINVTFSLRFSACGSTSGSKKRFFCQKCSDDDQQGTPPKCTLHRGAKPTSWYEAFNFCKENHMTLITPTIGNLILSQIEGKQPFWVGLQSDITFSWIDGTTFRPEDFDLHNVDGDCLSVFVNETIPIEFQLEDCKKYKPYLCDKVSAPTTVTETSTLALEISTSASAFETTSLASDTTTSIPDTTISVLATTQHPATTSSYETRIPSFETTISTPEATTTSTPEITTVTPETTTLTSETIEETTEHITTALEAQTSPTSDRPSPATTGYTESTNTSDLTSQSEQNTTETPSYLTDLVVNYTTSPVVNEGLQGGKKHHKGHSLLAIYISLAVFMTLLLVFLTASVLYLTHKRTSRTAKLSSTNSSPNGALPDGELASTTSAFPQAAEQPAQDSN